MVAAPLKLALFVDAQNVLHRARDTFHPSTSNHTDGQIDPRATAERIAGLGGPGGETVEVVEVRIYTGYHTPDRDQRSFSAYRRQRTFWERQGCTVTARPVRYWKSDGVEAREKGIDVALAVDYVRMAIERRFETGVIFSADNDLAPALEFVRDLKTPRLIPATAAWRGEGKYVQIWVQGVWCHRLDRDDYMAVHDPTDYAESVEEMATRLRRGWRGDLG